MTESIKKKIRKSGGHTNPSFVVGIPIPWIQIMGLDRKDSVVHMTLTDDDRIIIQKNEITILNDEVKIKKEGVSSKVQQFESQFE